MATGSHVHVAHATSMHIELVLSQRQRRRVHRDDALHGRLQFFATQAQCMKCYFKGHFVHHLLAARAARRVSSGFFQGGAGRCEDVSYAGGCVFVFVF